MRKKFDRNASRTRTIVQAFQPKTECLTLVKNPYHAIAQSSLEEQIGANFSSIAPSSDEYKARTREIKKLITNLLDYSLRLFFILQKHKYRK